MWIIFQNILYDFADLLIRRKSGLLTVFKLGKYTKQLSEELHTTLWKYFQRSVSNRYTGHDWSILMLRNTLGWYLEDQTRALKKFTQKLHRIALHAAGSTGFWRYDCQFHRILRCYKVVDDYSLVRGRLLLLLLLILLIIVRWIEIKTGNIVSLRRSVHNCTSHLNSNSRLYLCI